MLKDQRIVILGGTRGIGLAVAQGAAAAGADVVVVGSRDASVAAALAKLPAPARGMVADLRSGDAIKALFAQIGPFDHLAYTAGEPLPFGTPLLDMDLEQARSGFELRYWSVLATVQAAWPQLRKAGSIVLTSGTSARRPPAGFAIGASISGAVESLTRALALELAPIRVNVVLPGMVATELWEGVPAEARQQMFLKVGAGLPVGRIGAAEDIAEAYLSLMRGGYTTGQSVVVDGGATLV